MTNCIFCKIRDREIPKTFTYEDEDVMVFPDINPNRPIHLLVVPKKHLRDFLELEEDLGAKLIKITQKMITEQKLENLGYRVTVNGGGAQLIDHLHFHLSGPIKKKEVF